MMICLFALALFSVVRGQTSSLQELIGKKKFAEVIRLSERFTAADSAKVESVFCLGQAYEGLLKNREAYRCYTYCLQKDTTDIDLWAAAGRTAGALGLTQKALSCFQKILRNDSTDFSANYQIARLYMQQGDYEAAVYNFSYLLQFDKNNPVVWKLLGDCYSQLQTMESSIGMLLAYGTAFSLNPENASYGHLLANALMPMEKMGDQAILICQTALSYNPGHRVLQRDLGMAYYTERRYSKADSVFSSLMEQGDSSYLTLKYAGASRFHANMYMNAVEPLEKALEMDTTSVEVYLLLGGALALSYDRPRAFKLFDKAEFYMQPKPEWASMIALYKAEAYKRMGKLLEANRFYSKSYRIRPKRSLLYEMAQLFYRYRADSEEEAYRDRGLYNAVALADTVLQDPKADRRTLTYYKDYLRTFREAMFFKGLKKHPMISPEGKNASISIGRLDALISQIPDPPEPKGTQKKEPDAGNGESSAK